MSRALGRYELLRPLARGGMAEVYLARRRAAGVEKWLVVKRMRPERAGDARFLDLFVREARLSMSLAHQNIVPVFDFGRIDDQVFLAMERVEGKDLGSSLARTKAAMPPLLAAFVAAECCQALDYAHHRKGPDGAALGVVHRDVTPRNVLLSWSGEVKLTDFGIAALAGEDTNRLIGTPAYMAPEQARGEPLDARADVYALGLVLREALTGERARQGSDRDAIVAVARKAELPPWPPGVADELVAIADRATAASRDDRYPDARSMLEELDASIVARRAATKVESPARQLASWLAATWGNDRELGDELDEQAIAGEHLVSFLDDGALDVIGTGTERSLLATAAEIDDDAPDAPTSAPANESAPKLDAATSARMPAAGSAPKIDAATSARMPAAGSAPKLDAATSARMAAADSVSLDAATSARLAAIDAATSARFGVAGAGSTTKLRAVGSPRWGMYVIVGIVIAVVVYVGMGRRDREAPLRPPLTDPSVADRVLQPPTAPSHPAPSANGSAEATASNAATPANGSAAGSNAATPANGSPMAASGSNSQRPTTNTIDRHPADQRPNGLRPTGTNPDHRQAGSGTHDVAKSPTTTAVVPALERHKVTINSQPWSYFTIDDDPTSHQTVDQVMLAPGPHRIHFKNPQLRLEREITLDVPDHDTAHVEKLEN